MNAGRLPASFRDPDGYLFRHDGVLYRHVTARGAANYDRLVDSGLLASLITDGLLCDHVEVDPVSIPGHADAHRVLRPVELPFISYPYEWSFSQLADAAELTLELQRRALAHGMSLKDASAYNVQFVGGRCVFIDVLSFEVRDRDTPWPAYQQMCRHFLAPLALMAHRGLAPSDLRSHLDGVPLDLASRLLPRRTRLRFGLASHIHLHARSIRRHGATSADATSTEVATPKMGANAMLGLVDSLANAIDGLDWEPAGTEWAEYYDATNYSEQSTADKRAIVERMAASVAPSRAVDLGANRGVFSRILSAQGVFTVAADVDPAAVELNYRQARADDDAKLLPLVIDLTNPSPDLGWANRERDSFASRGPFDLALALALVHHLALGNNVPLPMIAAALRPLCGALIVEFVPKADSQVQRLLAHRDDIFDDYTREGFEAAFAEHFELEERIEVAESERAVYLYR